MIKEFNDEWEFAKEGGEYSPVRAAAKQLTIGAMYSIIFPTVP